ncbi:MAG: GNAT family N-acetyltransferase [Saprospiraceae bacterium]|nr:GNAT family N-acetyltransferase [Saprospiraceae bacterium]
MGKRIDVRTIENTTDLGAVSDLVSQLGYSGSPDKIRDRLVQLLDHPDHRVFIAYDGALTVGWIHVFMSLRVESDPMAEIGGLIVDERYRRQGIGHELVKTAIHWARDRNIHRIRVRCNSLRTDSHRFYEQLGFQQIKHQHVYHIDASPGLSPD